MANQSKQLITQEDARLAKLLDVLKAANVGGNINIEKISLGATREELDEVRKLVEQELKDKERQVLELNKKIKDLENGDGQQNSRIDELQDKVRELSEEMRKLSEARKEVKKYSEDSNRQQGEKGKKSKRKTFIISIVSAVCALVAVFFAIFIPLMVNYNSEKKIKFNSVDGGYSAYGGKYYAEEVGSTLTIPATYKGKPVVAIAPNGFSDYTGITEVIIPETVKTIGDGAFAGCKGLKTVTVKSNDENASSLITIDTRAFYGCDALFQLEFPEGVKEIGNEAFAGSALSLLTIPGTVEYIGKNAFADCGIDKVIIQDRISVPDTWNADWVNRDDVAIEFWLHIDLDYNGATSGNSQTKLYVQYNKQYALPTPERLGYTFGGWEHNGKSIVTADGIAIADYSPQIVIQAKWTANINTLTFHANGGKGEAYRQQIATDDTVALQCISYERKGYSFIGWATSADGKKVYDNCGQYTMGTDSEYSLYALWTANINTITFHSNGGSGEMTPQKIATDATAPLQVNSYERNGYSFVGWATSADGGKVYDNCGQYTIGTDSEYVLYALWAANINTITFHSNGGSGEMVPQKIATDATAELSTNGFIKNDSVFLGWATTATGAGEIYFDKAFYNMGPNANYDLYAQWKDVTPSSEFDFEIAESDEVVIKEYKGNATEVVIPEFINNKRVTSIGDSAFFSCSGLISIEMPNSVTSIGMGAFSGCSGLTSIEIPNSVTSIGSEAFSGCSGLTSIVVSSDNTKYHSSGNCLIETSSRTLMFGCKNSIIPTDGSVTSIGSVAFCDCSSLTSIEIPSGVTSIGDGAFYGCSGLTSIEIPNSVISIGYSVFYGCSGLTSISFNGTRNQWSTIVKGRFWDYNTGSYTVHCTDGDIAKY